MIMFRCDLDDRWCTASACNECLGGRLHNCDITSVRSLKIPRTVGTDYQITNMSRMSRVGFEGISVMSGSRIHSRCAIFSNIVAACMNTACKERNNQLPRRGQGFRGDKDTLVYSQLPSFLFYHHCGYNELVLFNSPIYRLGLAAPGYNAFLQLP